MFYFPVFTNVFLKQLLLHVSDLVLLSVKRLQELKRKVWDLCSVCGSAAGLRVFLPDLGLSGGWGGLGGFAAVWGATVGPQWELGLVGMPP